jgi:hypothetical protein
MKQVNQKLGHLSIWVGMLAALKESHPRKRIMFGAGLEAFFPAFGQLPPKGWTNWYDPIVAIRGRDAERLGELFDRESYDFVVIDPVFAPMGGRAVPFDISVRPYKLIQTLNGGVRVYQRTE